MTVENFIEEHPPWQRLLSDITSANTATIQISENGEYDVRNYAYADVNVSGGSSTGKVYFLNSVESPSYPVVEVDGVETELVDDILEMGDQQMPCKSVTAVIGSIIGFELVGLEIMACATATSDTSKDIPYTESSGSGTIVLPHENAFVAYMVS